jgi:hypothetical protein
MEMGASKTCHCLLAFEFLRGLEVSYLNEEICMERYRHFRRLPDSFNRELFRGKRMCVKKGVINKGVSLIVKTDVLYCLLLSYSTNIIT